MHKRFIHVVDLAKSHVKSFQWLQNENLLNNQTCETFNIGTGSGVSVLEQIKEFEKVNGIKINFKIGSRRVGDVVKNYANCAKANVTLNWQAEYSIADALKDAWKWQQNNFASPIRNVV